MKTVIEMAREVGLRSAVVLHIYGGKKEALCDSEIEELTQLERFAELVRADEHEKYKWDVHSCGPTCKRYACVAMREALEAEREACALLVEENAQECSGPMGLVLQANADAIRARGQS